MGPFLVAEVLQHVHNSLLWGHLGQKQIREKTLQILYWIGIWEDYNIWVTKCNEYARVKVPPKRPRVPLGKILVGSLLVRLATNILGPFPQSIQSNRYVLAVTHYFIK